MNTIKENSKRAFNQQAATYDSDIKGQHARTLYPYILKLLEDECFSSLLDLGCGTGEIDVANEKKIDKAHFILGDTEYLPFENNTFDVVICNDSFHHYPSPEKVLDESYRVLKKDGLIIIGDCWQPPLARQIMNIYMKYSKEGDVKIYSKQEMLSLLSRRFHNVTWEHIGTTSCISYAIK